MADGLTAAQIETINAIHSGTRRDGIGTLIGAQLPTVAEKALLPQAAVTSTVDLASTTTGKGASLIGVEDAAANFAGTTVEACLAEIISDLALTTTGNGASLIGLEDAAGLYTATDVEAALAELQPIKKFSKTIGHADLTAAATSEAIAFTGFPTNVLILGVVVDLTAEFSGGSVSACTMSIGDTGSATELLNAEDVFTGAGVAKKTTAAPKAVGQIELDYLTDGLDATFTTTTDNVVNLDAGSVTIDIYYVQI